MAIAVHKDLLNIYAFDTWTDLIDHLYFLVVDVWELAQGQQGALLSMDNNELARPGSQQEAVLSMDNNGVARPGRRLRRTRIVNVYDNTIGEGCTWQGAEVQWR